MFDTMFDHQRPWSYLLGIATVRLWTDPYFGDMSTDLWLQPHGWSTYPPPSLIDGLLTIGFRLIKASIKPLFLGGTLWGGSRLTSHHNWLFCWGGWPRVPSDIWSHSWLENPRRAYMFSIYGIYTCFAYTQILISSSFKKMEIFRIFSFNMKWILRVYLWFDPTPYTAVLPPFFYPNALEFMLRNYRADFHMCCIYFKGFGTLDRWILSEKPRVLLGNLTQLILLVILTIVTFLICLVIAIDLIANRQKTHHESTNIKW